MASETVLRACPYFSLGRTSTLPEPATMTHDIFGILKIALVVVLSSLALAGVATFYDGKASGKRTLPFALAVCGFVGLLQVVRARHLVWVVPVYAVLVVAGASWLRRRFNERN
jgi:hypothetical protein